MSARKIIIICVTIILVAALAAVVVFGYNISRKQGKSNEPIESEDVFAEDFKTAELADGSLEITAYNGSDVNVEIPKRINGKKVSAIGENAFRNDKYILSVVIPDSITQIKQCAFYNCTELENIEIKGKNLKEFDDFAFYGCSGLYRINIPSSVDDIAPVCFKGCGNLTVSCPNGSYAMGYAKSHSIKFVNE